jgi:hypothetical protein
MLAGSLIVNEGDVPGRPPGAEPEIIIDGRAAASTMIRSLFITKEKAMKTALIIMLLAVAVLLGPQMAATGEPTVAVNNQTVLNTANQNHTTAGPLSQAEMSAAVGGEMLGCSSGQDANGDNHRTCCFSLWLFSVCVDVNWSAVERMFDSIF